MGRLGKRARHLLMARAALPKRQRIEEESKDAEQVLSAPELVEHESVHLLVEELGPDECEDVGLELLESLEGGYHSDRSDWKSCYGEDSAEDGSESDDSEEEDDEDDEDKEDLENLVFDEELFNKELMTRNAFAELRAGAQEETAFSQTFHYQRGPQLSYRQQRRKANKRKELQAAAKGCISLDNFLKNPPAKSPSPPSPEEIRTQQNKRAIEDLEKKISRKSSQLSGQDLVRHRAVLSYLKIQRVRTKDETRKSLAFVVARCYGRRSYFARRLIIWEKTWIAELKIEEGRQGCFAKIKSWLNDEGVALAARDWIANVGEHITAYGLAKAIGEYLDSQNSIDTLQELFGPNGNRIRARTARRWLRKMGLKYDTVKKGVFVDGHERGDVVEYRQNVFIPKWREFQNRLVIFDEEGNWSPPSTLLPGEKPLMLCTQAESTFNANDGKRVIWMENGKQPIRPKGRGKGIMVSGFLTPGGVLSIPESISDAELLQNEVDWPLLPDGKPVRCGLQFLEYGKDNYWNGDKMVDHAIKVAAHIFPYAFPGCQGLFAFDNASNHCSFAADALVASKMNLKPGGSQPLMRPGYIHSQNRPQSMVFPEEHPDIPSRLWGKPKGIEQVLRERGLWRTRRSDGLLFCLQCPTTDGRPSCKEVDVEGGCCARAVMAAEQDFREQKGRLEEELNKLGYEVIFYPKFHCELNFIERYWCACKHYTREHCVYTFKGLQEQLPTALQSVGTAAINRYFNHCMRIIDAYETGHGYGTKGFSETVYKGHRQVVDKSKW